MKKASPQWRPTCLWCTYTNNYACRTVALKRKAFECFVVVIFIDFARIVCWIDSKSNFFLEIRWSRTCAVAEMQIDVLYEKSSQEWIYVNYRKFSIIRLALFQTHAILGRAFFSKHDFFRDTLIQHLHKFWGTQKFRDICIWRNFQT